MQLLANGTFGLEKVSQFIYYKIYKFTIKIIFFYDYFNKNIFIYFLKILFLVVIFDFVEIILGLP
jgi:hypothetical protein